MYQILSVIWIGVIAYLSFTNGKQTLKSSEKLYQYLPINMFFVRDFAHVFEFFVLTLFVLLSNHSMMIVWTVNLLSEVLKPLITTGRHCHLDDLGYNTIGMFLGWIVVKSIF